MKTFAIANHFYSAENCIDDILVNPVLPVFRSTAPQTPIVTKIFY